MSSDEPSAPAKIANLRDSYKHTVTSDSQDAAAPPADDAAKIAVIGAGWWGQGWHCPCLHQNPSARLVAIVDPNPNPVSTLANTKLESLETLRLMYPMARIFSGVTELLDALGPVLDGVIVSTPHSTHYDIAKEIFEYQQNNNNNNKPIHILMEKPMTTEMEHAWKLLQLVQQQQQQDAASLASSQFWINHSANFRPPALVAQQHGMPKIGQLRHVTASFASPVMWVFEDPNNVGWNVPTGTMMGNGFGWGQQSHLLAWIFFVCGTETLIPETVFCSMNHEPKTGADIAHSATISCANDVVLNVSGTALLPGSEYGTTRMGKQVRIQIYGTQGALLYEGDDEHPTSGRLEYRGNGENGQEAQSVLFDSFLFENATTKGSGPESLANFVQMCCQTNYAGSSANKDQVHNCANAMVGLRCVQTLEAMYRSHATKSVVKVLASEEESP